MAAQVFARPPPNLDSNHFHKSLVDASRRVQDADVPWEGTDMTEEQVKDRGYVPVPVKAGTLVAFAGTLDHLSLPNLSADQRHTFQLHVIESENVQWHTSNWLQTDRPEGFLPIDLSESSPESQPDL